MASNNKLKEFTNEMGSTDSKLNFIKNNSQLLDEYSGFVIDKNVKCEKFLDDDYIEFSFLLNGMVIINKLTEPSICGLVGCLLTGVIEIYCGSNEFVIGLSRIFVSISNDNTSHTTCECLSIVGSSTSTKDTILLVNDLNFKELKIDQAFEKCKSFFKITTINVVVLIQIYDRDPFDYDQFKSVAVVFQRNFSTVDPTSIISFGSQQLTPDDIKLYSNLSHNKTPITGTLYNNSNVNNVLNNPIYMITITPTSLFFNTPIPDGVGNLKFDLFKVKERMDIIQVFSSID